jgi:hypothetical protein
MKKMVWIMVIAIAVAFTACKEPELEPEPEHEPEHIHKWEWITIKPATCAAIGLEVGVCKLDASHTTIRVIALLAHTIAGTYQCSYWQEKHRPYSCDGC